ncbi:glycosyltransferase [Candidatus Gottesmanbacteria bacterium]|nr:glycosyltransferase [Candidatus Gottesmanbacteria bacterium]
MNPYVSFIIPAYNEETNIRLGVLEKVSKYLKHRSYTWEVLIVDDGSTDSTKTLIEEFSKNNKGFTAFHCAHQGKASTVISGIKMAKGEIVLFTDLDQATPLGESEKLLPWFEKGYDVVIGSRNTKREGAPLLRLIMARGFMILRSIVLGLSGITDTQCGFKAFRRPVALDIMNRLKLYAKPRIVSGSMVTAGFDIEVLFIGKRRGYVIREVPVEWHYVETRRVNPLWDSLQGLSDILFIRLNALLGEYEKKGE